MAIKREVTLENLDEEFELVKSVATSDRWGRVKTENPVWIVAFTTLEWTTAAQAQAFHSEEDAKAYVKNHVLGKIKHIVDKNSINIILTDIN
jgi:hypothetical protein